MQPKLVADIGGTNARFAIYDVTTDSLSHATTYPSIEFASIEEAIKTYLSTTNIMVQEAAIAIANPVLGDRVQMTNHHWQFSIRALQQSLGLTTLKVMNDFVAQAWAVLTLKQDEKRLIADKQPNLQAPIAVIGPGTGLGVSVLVPSLQYGQEHVQQQEQQQRQAQWQVLPTEGGHVSFAPRNELEIAILQYAQRIYGEHVSAERLLSGSGLALIEQALVHIKRYARLPRSAPQITKALARDEPFARETIDVFSSVLATVCADLILSAGARGGLYLCGGILPRFGNYFIEHSPFYTRFVDKGRFREYLNDIPVYLVMAQDTGLRGAAMALMHQ